ncbi:MAG: NUMOD3 domain-containing DNA-binding protein [Nanoarchaeota archaeon]
MIKFKRISSKNYFKNINCKICNTQIKIYKSGKDRKFCSYKCMGIGKQKQIQVKCLNCNENYYIQFWRKKITKFCSKKCWYDYWKKFGRNEETINKVSNTLKRKYKSGEIIAYNIGKHLSEETIKKISKNNIGKHPLNSGNFKKEHKIRKKYYNGRKSITEIRFEKFLKIINIEFIPQKSFRYNIRKGKLYYVDFYFPQFNTILEIDNYMKNTIYENERSDFLKQNCNLFVRKRTYEINNYIDNILGGII